MAHGETDRRRLPGIQMLKVGSAMRHFTTNLYNLYLEIAVGEIVEAESGVAGCSKHQSYLLSDECATLHIPLVQSAPRQTHRTIHTDESM